MAAGGVGGGLRGGYEHPQGPELAARTNLQNRRQPTFRVESGHALARQQLHPRRDGDLSAVSNTAERVGSELQGREAECDLRWNQPRPQAPLPALLLEHPRQSGLPETEGPAAGATQRTDMGPAAELSPQVGCEHPHEGAGEHSTSISTSGGS